MFTEVGNTIIHLVRNVIVQPMLYTKYLTSDIIIIDISTIFII